MNREQHAKLFHDLKNDLASMTALLNLHKLYKDSISTEELLNRLYERQTVMALAYEKLYQENDYPNIQLRPFITDLMARENRTLGSYCTGVQIRKHLTETSLPIKRLTPLAQILVELVTNSYRHAFNGSDGDRIIEFEIKYADDEITFSYSDNGTGFPAGFEPAKSRTLGMQFIISLSKQLGSVPDFNIANPDEGMRFGLQFRV